MPPKAKGAKAKAKAKPTAKSKSTAQKQRPAFTPLPDPAKDADAGKLGTLLPCQGGIAKLQMGQRYCADGVMCSSTRQQQWQHQQQAAMMQFDVTVWACLVQR